MDETVCISPNTLHKDLNSIIIVPAIGKEFGRLNSLTLVWQPVYKKEN